MKCGYAGNLRRMTKKYTFSLQLNGGAERQSFSGQKDLQEEHPINVAVLEPFSTECRGEIVSIRT